MWNRLKHSLTHHRTVNELSMILTAVMVAILYILLALAFDEDLLGRLDNPMMDAVTLFSGLLVLAVIVFLFIVPFLSYMNRLLVERRAREFGMLRLMGLSASRLAAQLGIELGILGIGGVIAGLLLGVLLSKAIGMLLVRLMGRQVFVPLLINGYVALMVIILFSGLFLIFGLVNWLYIKQLPLTRIARGRATTQTMPMFTPVKKLLAVLGVVLTLLADFGYLHLITWTNAYNTIRPPGEFILFWLGLLVVLLVGNYWLLRYSLPVIFLRLMRFEWVKNHATRLLVVTNLAKRLSQNSRSTFLTVVLSALTMVIIGGGTILFQFGQDTVDQSAPLPIVTTASGKELVAPAVRQGALTPAGQLQTKIIAAELRSAETVGDRTVYNLIRLSDYRRIKRLQGDLETYDLQPGEAVLVIEGGALYRETWMQSRETWRAFPMTQGPGLKIVGLQKYFPLGADIYFERALIVSDADYKRLDGTADDLYYFNEAKGTSLTGVPQDQREFVRMDPGTLSGDKKPVISRQGTPESQGRSTVVVRATLLDTMGTFFGFGLFVAGIMGAVFMLGTAAMLLLKQLILGIQERGLRRDLQSVGMSLRQVRRVVLWQTVSIFIIPLSVGALNAGLMIRIMSTLLDNPGYLVTLAVLLCYVLVYLLFALLCARLLMQFDRDN